MELRRAASGLVKVICRTGGQSSRGERKKAGETQTERLARKLRGMVWIHQYDEHSLCLVPCQLGSLGR